MIHIDMKPNQNHRKMSLTGWGKSILAHNITRETIPTRIENTTVSLRKPLFVFAVIYVN